VGSSGICICRPEIGLIMSPPTTAPRSVDLRLARLHLRLGALALARAELETLAGRDALDIDGLTDLAEVRWRTGDLTGAGEAAAAIMDGDDGPAIALIVAAEASMARGRPTDARRYADLARSRAGSTLDALFAGMPRCAIWPADPAAQPLASASLFDVPAVGPAAVVALEDTRAAAPPTPTPDASSTSPGLWDDGAAAPTGDRQPDVERVDLPIADDELLLAREALEEGRPDDAAVHLALVLRLTPALAPAVLDLVGADRRPGLAFVRGDAYRLVGHETAARQAYADVTRPGRATPSRESGDPVEHPLTSADPIDPIDPADAPDATDPTDHRQGDPA
jgi:hypothetical protein